MTNTSTAKVDVPVVKKWVGPAAGEVTVSLKRGDAVVGTLKLNEGNGWKGSFEGLPKYDATGAEIEYAVAEDEVDGYKADISGDAQGGFTVTNASTAKVDVPVEKKWVGPAADKATARLLAGGQDSGKSVELNEGNGWKASFEGLPKYDASGAEIAYTVEEDAVEGYSTAVTGDAQAGFTVTNTSTAKVDVPVVKKWVGPAAGEVTVSLKRGDAVVGTLKLDEAGGWKGTFSGLPKYDASGAEIEYAVEEDAVDGYSSAVTGDAHDGFTVTNTSTATVNVPVEKKWVGPAAEKAVVRLLAGGQDAEKSLELNESNGWKASFEGLPKYDSRTGAEIEYAVEEDEVAGYSTAVSGDAHDGFTVTNTSTATVSVPVEKKWVGPAAEKATVRLLAGGQDSGQSVELNESNGWKASFEGLPKYDSQTGEEIAYTVAEDAVDGYDSAVTGSAQAGFTVTNTSTATVSLPVEKKWVGPAAEKAVVRLLAFGQDSGKSLELSDANGWKGTFSGLPKYDAKTGAEIEYAVAEDEVAGYDSAVSGDAHDGFTVTNTSTAKVDVPVVKKWVGPAAGEVAVSLKRGDAVVGTLKLNAEGEWKGSFEGLPKYDSQTGAEIEYTVEEDEIAGYSSAVSGDVRNGFTVTNTYVGETGGPSSGAADNGSTGNNGPSNSAVLTSTGDTGIVAAAALAATALASLATALLARGSAALKRRRK